MRSSILVMLFYPKSTFLFFLIIFICGCYPCFFLISNIYLFIIIGISHKIYILRLMIISEKNIRINIVLLDIMKTTIKCNLIFLHFFFIEILILIISKSQNNEKFLQLNYSFGMKPLLIDPSRACFVQKLSYFRKVCSQPFAVITRKSRYSVCVIGRSGGQLIQTYDKKSLLYIEDS